MDMAPELVEAALKTVATIERLASTLPPSAAGAASFYAPPQPLPPVPGDKYTWDVITEEQGVKARGVTRRSMRHAGRRSGTLRHRGRLRASPRRQLTRCAAPHTQVYGRRSDDGPPHAVGVAHFTQSADEVAAYLFDPNHMGDWDAELCEKGQVRRHAAAPSVAHAAQPARRLPMQMCAPEQMVARRVPLRAPGASHDQPRRGAGLFGLLRGGRAGHHYRVAAGACAAPTVLRALAHGSCALPLRALPRSARRLRRAPRRTWW